MVNQAELLAAVLEDAGDAELAARRTAELSDRFDRPERLEAQFLMAALRVRPEARLEDLHEEIEQRLASFPERFPDSKLIRAVPIDASSPEGIDEFFREHIEPGAEHVHEIAEQLRRGEAPISSLAAVVGKPVSVVTLQLGNALPLAFGDDTLSGLEQESAAQAVGRAVIWDPAAITVVASLQPAVSELLRTAFPASLTAQATIDDVNRARDTPSLERDEYSVLGYDAASGRRFMLERPGDEIAREREAITRAVAIAQTLQVKPDVDPGKPTEVDGFFEAEERNPAFATWPASIALAQREGKPLYSDDRFIRVNARRFGIPAFGTLATLEVLTRRGFISEEQRLAARAQLRNQGAMGIGTSIDELFTEARANNWLLTRGVAFPLLDPTFWAPTPVEAFRTWAAFLRTVHEEAPDRFEAWVRRFLDAASRNLPGRSFGFLAQSLLLIAWQPFNPQARSFAQALITALRRARNVFGWYPDPVTEAARRLAEMSPGEAPELEGVLASAFLRDLDFHDQLLLLGISL